MWLKVSYSPEKLQDYSFDTSAVTVEFVDSLVAPISSGDKSVRISPVFPLDEASPSPCPSSFDLYLFEYSDPFRVLGHISQFGSDELVTSTLFSTGACSVLLLVRDETVLQEFRELKLPPEKAHEIWRVSDGCIVSASYNAAEAHPTPLKQIRDYSTLPLSVIAILDEFVASIQIIGSKTDSQEHHRILQFQGLVERIDSFVEELLYLHTLDGDPPPRFWTQHSDLKTNALSRDLFSQQIIDRVIQINSALSYVSTQMYSGSVPVLERRSLIRRNSLLGIGSALRALDRIVRHIESAFRGVDFEKIIREHLVNARPLLGTDDPTYPDKTQWSEANLQILATEPALSGTTQKLAYFSSRNGFRESEFAITAALNSLWNGLSLEWSLMTITHEMLHSHVRLLLTFLFLRDAGSEVDNYKEFYERYYSKVVENQPAEDYSLLDSIRELIFTYCLRTKLNGSITTLRPLKISYVIKAPRDFSAFYETLRNEYRNVNEILVHVLDLQYFYGGRASKYIPLIWSSWSAVPNVRADLRQYILRSLLALASKTKASEDKRFAFAVEDFKAVLEQHDELKKKFPILVEVEQILANSVILEAEYYAAFVVSLPIVDLAAQIFFSQRVSQTLWNDTKISFPKSEDSIETDVEYTMPVGFFDDSVDCPVPYLFDRMLRVLREELLAQDQERNMALAFLALMGGNADA